MRLAEETAGFLSRCLPFHSGAHSPGLLLSADRGLVPGRLRRPRRLTRNRTDHYSAVVGSRIKRERSDPAERSAASPVVAKGAAANPLLALQRLAGNRAVASLIGLQGRSLQRQARGGGLAAGAAALLARATAAPGIAPPDHIQRRFASHLGIDVSGVRLHTGEVSAAAAKAVAAHAFTVGQDIHFGEHSYAPGSPDGDRLIAHEVAHTVQQAGSAAVPLHQLAVSEPGDAGEVEAERIAERVAAPVGECQAGGVEPLVAERTSQAASIQRIAFESDVEDAIQAALALPAPGLELAIYSQVGHSGLREIERAAQGFAANHRTLGVHDGLLVCGADAAMHADTIPEVIAAITDTRDCVDQSSFPGAGDLRISTLALFAHGEPDWLGFHRSDSDTHGESPESFAQQIDAALTDDARVVLYACSTGGNTRKRDWQWSGGHPVNSHSSDPEERRTPTTTEEAAAELQTDVDRAQLGEGSYADRLRDALDSGGLNREVWGRRMWGNSEGNPSWRRFRGPQGTAPASTMPLAVPDVESDRWLVAGVTAICDPLQRALAADDSVSLITRSHLERWLARELPFAPFDQFTTVEADGSIAVTAGLVDWLGARYRDQRPSNDHY